MAEVKQYLFSIEVFIAIMILNKWDLRLLIDISPNNLDSGLCFFQPSISHDVLCIEVQ